MSKEQTDLLPCPFCGAHLVPYADSFPDRRTERHSERELNACGAMTCPTAGCPSGFSLILTDEREEVAAWNRRASPSPAGGVQGVRALEWKAYNDPSEGRVNYGSGAFGHWYAVSRKKDGVWSIVHHVAGKPVHLPLARSIDEAKAAAQSDYEQRILSALSSQAQTTGGVE